MHSASARFELSYAQQALWFIHQTNQGCSAYNVSVVLESDSKIDPVALKRAFLKLIGEQSLLRSLYLVDSSGAPYRVVLPTAEEALQFDVRETEGGRNENRADVYLEASKPFDLEKPPVIRVGLYLHQDGGHTIHICIHHLNFDGGSRSILASRLQDYYEAETGVGSGPTSNEVGEYNEYVARERAFLQSEKSQGQLDFWTRQLQGELPVLMLFREFPRPTAPSHIGKTVRVHLSSQATQDVIRLVRAARTTPYSFFLSVFRLALYFHTNQSDLIVGTAVGGAPSGLKETLGYFVNKLSLRLPVNEQNTFSEFLESTSGVVRDCLDRKDYPFPLLVEKLRVARDGSHSAIFQANFTFLKMDLSRLKDPKWKFGSVDQQEGQFEIALRVVQLPDTFSLSFQYDSALTAPETVESVARVFGTLCEQVLSQPNTRVSELAPLPSADRELIDGRFNRTEFALPADGNVIDLFEEQVARFPERTALSFQGQRLTYRALGERVNALASVLVEKGVGRGETVALLIEPSAETMIAMLAALKAGGAFLPIESSLPGSRIEFILKDSGARVLIRKVSRSERLEFSGQVIDLAQSEIQARPITAFPRAEATDPAYVIYTSGTTGQPKGVVIERRCLLNYVHWFKAKYAINESSVSALLTSYAFDLGYTTLWTTVLAGGDLHILPESVYKDVGALLKYFRDFKINFIKLTPSLLNAIVNTREFADGPQLDLKIVVTGGERAKSEDYRQLFARYPELLLVNHYGPTETTIGVMTYPMKKDGLDAFARRPVIGRPNGNVKAYVTDSHFRQLPIGVPGELLISGDCVGRGYIGREELTREKFIADPFDPARRVYRSGDLARWLRDGTVEFLGRIDRQVKIRGYRVELGEVEQQIQAAFGFKKVAAVEKSIAGASQICAYYVAPQILGVDTMKETLREKVPDYMVPSFFVRLDEIPTTANGKLDMRALPEPDAAPVAVESQTPMDQMEREIAELWARLLGRAADSIGPDENFFALGGHSILAIRLISELRTKFGVSIPIATLYGEGTVRALRNALTSSPSRAPGTDTLVAFHTSGSGNPVFFAHPIGGHVSCYRLLSERLESHPFFGLPAPAGDQAPRTIEKMAERFLGLIAGRGMAFENVVLGGWSMGGMIAFEMARQLRAQGRHPKALIMLDSFAPSILRERYGDTKASRWLLKDLETVCGGPLPLDFGSSTPAVEEVERRFNEILPALGSRVSPEAVQVLKDMFAHYRVGREAVHSYHPGALDFEATLLRATDLPDGEQKPVPDNGWTPLIGKLTVVDVPGNHHTLIGSVHAPAIARKILEAFKRGSV